MSKYILFALLFLFLTLNSPFIIHNSSARTTPEDILNSQKQLYNQKVSKYSLENKQKLESLSEKIAAVNKKETDILSFNMERQGEILDEYIARTQTQQIGSKDGIHRNLSQPVENARYWLTYAHEAVAFQAAKVYVFNLTQQSNIKSDANSTISNLESDLNTLKTKVIKSQNIIKDLVTRK